MDSNGFNGDGHVDMNDYLARNLRLLQTLYGIRQEDIKEAIGKHNQYEVSRILRGDYDYCSCEDLANLADLFNVDADLLVTVDLGEVIMD